MYLKQWCDSVEGEAHPFENFRVDYADVRIAICNWGLWNPCHGEETDRAWGNIGDQCPDEGEGDDETVATGLWYKSAWRKGYWRSNCTTGNLCLGDVTRVWCRNEGEGTWTRNGGRMD